MSHNMANYKTCKITYLTPDCLLIGYELIVFLFTMNHNEFFAYIYIFLVQWSCKWSSDMICCPWLLLWHSLKLIFLLLVATTSLRWCNIYKVFSGYPLKHQVDALTKTNSHVISGHQLSFDVLKKLTSTL